MNKKNMHGVRNFILAGVTAFVAGCTTYIPLTDKMDDGLALKVGAEVPYYNAKLGKSIQTTPVHKDDAGFLTGDTTSDAKYGIDVSPLVGINGNIGNSWLRLNAGVDGRFNTMYLNRGEYRSGIYNSVQQSSDTRPAASGSFNYSQLTPDAISIIPYIGVDILLSENIFIGGEFGLPYSGFEAQSGWDRWSRWEEYQKDDWEGFGRKYGIKIGFKDKQTSFIGIRFDLENYPHAEFKDEKARINRFSVGIEVKEVF